MTGYDPHDPEQVADAELRARRARELELDDLRVLLGLPEGRRFVWRVLAESRAFASSFHPEPSRAAFGEGKRRVGLWLLAELQQADPTAFLGLMTDHWSPADSTSED